MFHSRLNSVHWSCWLLLLAAVVIGCRREEPAPTVNETREVSGPQALVGDDLAVIRADLTAYRESREKE